MVATLRNNVTSRGDATARPILFLHGFGCDQSTWTRVAPAFEDDHHVVLLDHVGSGGADASAFRPARYRTLHGYARDVLEVCQELDLQDVVVVAHSVSAMIAVLAANADPARFSALVLVGPSPRYLDDDGYTGGFTREDVDHLLETMQADFLSWSAAMAPAIMGNADRPALGEELTASFCRTDPDLARHFAKVTFLSDNRADLAHVQVRSLVLQCREDVIAPQAVGEYVYRHTPGSAFQLLDVDGHCPHVSAPDATVAAIRAFL